MTSEQLKQWSADILYLQDINRKQQAQIEELKKENEELSTLCFEFGILRKAQEK